MKDPAGRATRLWMMLLPAWVACMIPLYFLCALLSRPWNLLLTCVCAWALTMALLWTVYQRVLRRYPYPARSVVVDARLVLTGALAVRQVCSPLKPSPKLRMSAGSSMLLLTHSAALILPLEPKQRSERALLTGLGDMKVDVEAIQRRTPVEQQVQASGLIWHIYREGPQVHAVACGTAWQMVRACSQIWERTAIPLTEEHRATILHAAQKETVPPLCFAMADWTENGVENACYLGMFCFAWVLREDAGQDVMRLRDLGLNVSLTGMTPAALVDVASQLGCATICPDRKPLVLTSVPAGGSAEVWVDPEEGNLARPLARLEQMQRMLPRWGAYLTIGLAAMGLYLLRTSVPTLVAVLLYGALLCLLAFSALFVERADGLPLRRGMARMLVGCGVLLLVGLAAVRFLRGTVGVVPAAEVNYLVPPAMLLVAHMFSHAEAWRTRRTWLLLAAVAVEIVCLVVAARDALLPALFTMVAGWLGVLMARGIILLGEHVPRRYATRRGKQE